MSDPTWITSSETLTAQGAINYADVKNRCGRYIWDAFTEEHSVSGVHEDLGVKLVQETGTYTGNGTGQTISLTLTSVTPKFIWIWLDYAIYSRLWIDADPTHTYRNEHYTSTSSPLTTAITGADEGEFTVATNNGVNANGYEYHYLVLGSANEGIAPSGGSDPTWIADGESLTADGTSSSMANKVEGHIWTQFKVDHNDDGTHKDGTGFGLGDGAFLETGEVEGDGGWVTISLATPIDPKFILWVKETVNFSRKWIYGMSNNTLLEGKLDGFIANYIQNVDVGEFEIATSASATYYYIVIGPTG